MRYYKLLFCGLLQQIFTWALCIVLLSSFKSIDQDQPITVRSAYSAHVFVIPRGYFLYPPPLDGLLKKSTAEAFLVDYPDFNFQSQANRQKFRTKGSPDIVSFIVHLAPTRSLPELLKLRLKFLKKSVVGHFDKKNSLVSFESLNPGAASQKSIFVDRLNGSNFLECYDKGSVPSPSCQMYFIWDGLTLEVNFKLQKLSERESIKRKVINKLKNWNIQHK